MSITSSTQAGEVFLQNQYFSLGISKDGTIGTMGAAPRGFVTDSANGYTRLGLVADLDGFGKGKAPLNDAIIRGAAVEGYNIGYKIAGTTFVHSNQELVNLNQIAGQGSNASTSTVGEADWKGATTEKLDISQKITLTDDAKFLRVDVTFTNDSVSTMTDLRYMRTVDPDQGSDYATNNKILEQGHGEALVAAYASGTSNPFFLYADDPRAVVSIYGFINQDPYASAAYASPQAVGYGINSDKTLNIDFGLGDLKAGQSETITYYVGVTNDLNATLAAIKAQEDGTPPSPPLPAPPPPPPPPLPVNHAPVAVNDSLQVVGTAVGTGNVLSNDSDADHDTLTAALKSASAHGTVKLGADGSFTYVANAGYVGSDTFSYTASDGKASSTGVVMINVGATPPTIPGLPASPLLTRPGTVDGSSTSNDTLTGVNYHNSFYFDPKSNSGADRITNFQKSDVLVVNGALNDGNHDGLISFSGGKLHLDLSGGGDTVSLPGIAALRFLGTDSVGLSVYGDASVRPKGALEGKLGDDVLSGDTGDRAKNVFFFDTALDVNLGHDQIGKFGSKDILVTTSAIPGLDASQHLNLGADGTVNLAGGSGAPNDPVTAGEAGSVAIHEVSGSALPSLEFDGSVIHNGVTYYVYSEVGSAAGTASLTF